MDIEKIQPYLDTDKSLRLIAEELKTSQSNLRYWIKKHGLIRNKSKLVSTKYCLQCNVECEKTFCSTKCRSIHYYYRNQEKLNDRSKTLGKNKREIFKLLAIEYGGNKCQHCQYNKNYSALSFHHTDPTQKDFSFGGIRSNVLTEVHKQELDKCILLCHNCHFKVHSAWNNLIPKGKQAIKGAKVRRSLIDYKGGSCNKCKVTGINDIFSFHHIDENTKEFNIDARACNGYLYDRLVKEADKCLLLCHNCHTEEHYPNNLLK